jgi:uncharacterized protein YacL
MHMFWIFLFLAACTGSGFAVLALATGNPSRGLAGAVAGLLAGLVFSVTARALRKLPARTLIGGALGLSGAVLLAAVAVTIVPAALRSSPLALFTFVMTTLGLVYSGIVLGSRKGEEFSLEELLLPLLQRPSETGNQKLLDTSVIIDGRIADLCDTGFIEGELIIPQFVLQELQHIADSADTLKRNRGRRGLDILQEVQKKTEIQVRITDQDFPKIREVDAKLVALARKLNAKIVTNDFNLNKVAELNGVQVLNINLLANAVKPVVLPGEIMQVHILREGKEQNQGVAYLDDGTMVVVDTARNHIGRNVEVSVTSVLQTTAGRMIFTQMKDGGPAPLDTPAPVTGAEAHRV